MGSMTTWTTRIRSWDIKLLMRYINLNTLFVLINQSCNSLSKVVAFDLNAEVIGLILLRAKI